MKKLKKMKLNSFDKMSEQEMKTIVGGYDLHNCPGDPFWACIGLHYGSVCKTSFDSACMGTCHYMYDNSAPNTTSMLSCYIYRPR